MIFPYADVFIPDGDEARRWAEEELANPRYADAKPTWFDLLARDIGRFLADLFSAENGANVGPTAMIVIIVVIFAALVAALIIWGRPRSARAVRRSRIDLLGADDDRTSAQLRADAERSARNGDWDEATILRFRAIARGLIERDLIDPTPGATAQAIAREISKVFPEEAVPVRQAATSFDDVRYLGHPSSSERYAELAATDDRLRALRPDLVNA
jgi:hypothetical protein